MHRGEIQRDGVQENAAPEGLGMNEASNIDIPAFHAGAAIKMLFSLCWQYSLVHSDRCC